jgi:hypothetical protein
MWFKNRNCELHFIVLPSIRNEALIPILLQKAFPKEHEEVLAISPIFSRQHVRERGKKDLQTVVEHFEQKFHEMISLENVIRIDDYSEVSMAGQNFIDVPKAFELGKDRLFYVVGLLNELFNSEPSPSAF